MPGIPPVADTDAEDVAWALQTAEALWKRNERVDAIVWLRRAAQAAGEAEDDDRALALARDAAELSDWLAQNPNAVASTSLTPKPPSNAPTASEAVDDLLRTSQTDEIEIRVSVTPMEPTPVATTPARPPPPPPPPPPSPPPPLVKTAPLPPPMEPAPPPAAAPAPVEAEPEIPSGERASHVPSAAEKHAGMLDPWADPEPPTRQRSPSPPPPPPAAPSSSPPPAARAAPVLSAPPTPPAFEPEEVVTSAPPVAPPTPAKPPPPLPPPRKPPPPPSAKVAPKPATPPTAGVDLSNVEALADLPDDAREAFASAAKVQQLSKEEEVSGFALALVLEGQLDLAATMVDAPAARLDAGKMVRTHGTIEHVTPLRLICASDAARVAVWDETAVDAAFRTCPWVEDDLRAAGDRFQAEVGVTMGALGERLDWSLRSDLTRRLTLRSLAEHEVTATRGKPMPGLLLVGAGELELVDDADAAVGEPLRAGDFVFPTEVLHASPAPHTVRAAKGGALVLFAERGVAQELLVTCPPLLEIFAGA
jgi:hypothetical protein